MSACMLGFRARSDAARPIEADDQRGAGDQVFKKPGQDRIAGDFGEAEDGIGRKAGSTRRGRREPRRPRRRRRWREAPPAPTGRRGPRRKARSVRSTARARLENVARLPRLADCLMNAPRFICSVTTPRSASTTRMRRIWVRLHSKTSHSAAFRQFRAGRQLLLHHRSDDPLDDRRVRKRLPSASTVSAIPGPSFPGRFRQSFERPA